MSLFSILKTPKGSDNAQLIGQTKDASPANARDLAEKATGEKPTGMTVVQGETLTVQTPGHNIDFVDKSLVAQIYGRVIALLIFVAISTTLPAQTQQAPPKPHTCTYYGQDMKYCGKASWKSYNRCKTHHPNQLYKAARNYHLIQWRKANRQKNH